MRDHVAATAFGVVNGLLFPASLLGYVVWVSGLVARRRSGVSATAQGPLFARWMTHELGVRSDEPAQRLMRVLPGVPTLARRLVSGPTLVAHRLTGHVPGTFRYPVEGDVPPLHEIAARTTFLDAAVDHHLAEVDQLVVLGAGFDTRAFRLPEGTTVPAFEVDAPTTQAVKREMVAAAGIDTARVRFVAADLEHDDWLALLVAAGFDPDRRALFLCEGLVMYLDEGTVRKTFRTIADTPAGSVVAFDYLTTEPLTASGLQWRYARAATRAGREPLTFGVDSTPPARENLRALLRSCGLALTEHRTLGHEDRGERAWGGLATAAVP